MIRVEKISRRYADSAAPVLDNLSVDFRPGRISVILGRSGAGKSTLINCLLQADYPESGCILLDGVPLKPDKTDPRLISGMLQSTALFQHMSILENLTLAPRVVLKKPAAEANREALGLLNQLGILEKAYAFPNQLSGGEAQRAGLARALMMKPRVLVLDEPASALNDEWVCKLADLLKTLKAGGTTVILSTHHLAFAETVADDLYLLEDGRLIGLDAIPDTVRPNRKAGLKTVPQEKTLPTGEAFIRLYP